LSFTLTFGISLFLGLVMRNSFVDATWGVLMSYYEPWDTPSWMHGGKWKTYNFVQVLTVNRWASLLSWPICQDSVASWKI
jgi:hypothetical protein